MDLLYWQVEPHYILGITPSEACLYGTVDGWWPLNNPQRGLAAHGPKCKFFHSFTTISKLCPEAVCLLDKGGVGGPYEPKMLALPERGGLCPLPGFFWRICPQCIAMQWGPSKVLIYPPKVINCPRPYLCGETSSKTTVTNPVKKCHRCTHIWHMESYSRWWTLWS